METGGGIILYLFLNAKNVRAKAVKCTCLKTTEVLLDPDGQLRA